MAKYLFVDGNNLGIRSAFANSELSVDLIDFNKEDFDPDSTIDNDPRFPTGALHGFMRTLISFRCSFPDYYLCVVWDGGYEKRLAASQQAVKTGVVPEPYKANRKRGEIPKAIKDFVRQKPELQKIISATNIPQVVIQGEEADDVIASYTRRLTGSEIILQTNDKDYYQLLDENVSMLKGDGDRVSKEWFVNEFKIQPKQWIDVGALQGDSGDNIFGIPGWGETTAVKSIIEHGDYKSVLKSLHDKYDETRKVFPDLTGESMGALKSLKTKSGTSKYPDLCEWMPFTGVALAYEEKGFKIPKVALMALMYESRTDLAYQLKKMHDELSIPKLPSWDRAKKNELLELCQKYSLVQVSQSADLLCAKLPDPI